MPSKQMPAREFQTRLQRISKTHTEAELATIIHDSPNWASMTELQSSKFHIALIAHKAYLTEEKKILAMSDEEKSKWLEFYKQFDYAKHLQSELSTKKKNIGVRIDPDKIYHDNINPEQFYFNLKLKYHEQLKEFLEQHTMPKNIVESTMDTVTWMFKQIPKAVTPGNKKLSHTNKKLPNKKPSNKHSS